MREISTAQRSHESTARHVRAAMRLGNCTRSVALGLNAKRRSMGLAEIDLTGISTPAEIKIRHAKARAGLRTLAERALRHAEAAQAAARR